MVPNNKKNLMKQFIKFALVFAAFCTYQSCMMSYFSQNTDTGKLMDFPIIPHQNEVEVYFEGEKPTDTAYLKLRIIDMHGGANVATAAMITALKEEAQNYGVDAIILLDDKAITKVNTNYWNKTHPYSVENRRFMCVLGIKYKRNIQDTIRFITKHQIALFDSSMADYKPILDLEVDLEGNTKNMKVLEANKAFYYHQYIKKYSLAWLIYDKSSDWKYDGFSETGTMPIKRIYKYGYFKEQVNVFYKLISNGQVAELRIKEVGKKPQDIFCKYPNKTTKQPNVLTVTEKGKEIYKHVFNYDENGNLQTSIFYRIINGKESPLLRIKYGYFKK
jgi:hypothetical protein